MQVSNERKKKTKFPEAPGKHNLRGIGKELHKRAFNFTDEKTFK